MPATPPAKSASANEPWLEVSASRYFPAWLGEHRISLAFTTYQAGKLMLLGKKPDGGLAVFERTFHRCMGLWADDRAQTLWLSSLYELWRLENALAPSEHYLDHDRLYIPRAGHVTGDLDAHDLAVDSKGRVIFVNTHFNCLATISERKSFVPLWKPPFISRLAREDRCHLNGMAMENGAPAYVTACSTSDIIDGWREHRSGGGCVIDVRSNQIVASGLSMPHSPRVHRGKLYVHNSGTGFFGTIDLTRGTFEPIVFCPGYLRGLAFAGDYAVVGLSKPREKTFTGLPLDDELSKRNIKSWCGLQVIDLRTGDVAQWVRVEGSVSELYDVAILSGAAQPMALGFVSDEIQRILSIDDAQQL